MREKEEHLFQQSNSVGFGKNLLIMMEKKLVTRKFRGAAHWACNINFQVTKKFQ